MQKVIKMTQIAQYLKFMDKNVLDYICQWQTESFESFENFNLLAFDLYDENCSTTDTPKILIYMDKEDLFFICENDYAYEKASSLLHSTESNERVLVMFFSELIKNDMMYLDNLETEITDAEDDALFSTRKDYLKRIVSFRKELLNLKRYYEHLCIIFDDLSDNENKLVSRDCERRFAVLYNRADRFCRSVLNLRDYVTQMREAYQAQIDIEQNKLMKVFTLVTAVFLPLTLLVGWYGMNFKNMPELSWDYGYPVMIGVSAIICIALVIYFKKKKWF